MGKPDSEEKKKFRAAFFRHIHGRNKTAIGRYIGCSDDKVDWWGKDGKALPDIWEVKKLAEYIGETPSLIAFGERAITPREFLIISAIEQAANVKITPDAGAASSLPRDDSSRQSHPEPLSNPELLAALALLSGLLRKVPAESAEGIAGARLTKFLLDEAEQRKLVLTKDPPASEVDTVRTSPPDAAVEK